MFLALDVASSELWVEDGKTYEFKKSARRPARRTRWSRSTRTGCGSTRSSRSRTALAEGDWDGWKTLTTALGSKIQLVGDDLFVTNPEILKRGIDREGRQLDPVKLNQIGTVTETLDAVAMATTARLHQRHLAPLRRNRRHDHRRPGGRHRRRPDQDRLGQPHRPRRQVQPAAAHRRSTRLAGGAMRAGGDQARWEPTDHAHSRPAPTRRKHLEQGKPVHRLDRRRPVRPRRATKRAQPGGCCKEGGYAFDLAYTSVLKRAIQTLSDRARRARSAVDPGRQALAAERAPLRRAAGAEQGRDRGEARRGAGARSGAAATTSRRRRCTTDDERHPGRDPRYAGLSADELPMTESLKDTVDRVPALLARHHRAGDPAAASAC